MRTLRLSAILLTANVALAFVLLAMLGSQHTRGTATLPAAYTACMPQPGEFFNPCATLDPTQVQDRRGDLLPVCDDAQSAAHLALPEINLPCLYVPHTVMTHADTCQIAADLIFTSQDYSGSATEVSCFGEEDDSRVALALDYGMTLDVYRLAELYA